MTYIVVSEYKDEAGPYRYFRTYCSYKSKSEFKLLYPRAELEKPIAENVSIFEAQKLIYSAPNICLPLIAIENLYDLIDHNSQPDEEEFANAMADVKKEIVNFRHQRIHMDLDYQPPFGIGKHLRDLSMGVTLKAKYLKAIIASYNPLSDYLSFYKLGQEFELLKSQ